MSVRQQLTAPGFTPLELGSALSNRRTSFGEFLGANLEEGVFNAPLLGGTPPELFNTPERIDSFIDERLDELRSVQPNRTFTEDDLAALRENFQREAEQQLQRYRPMDQAAWAASPWFREDIPFEDGMTAERAQWLAQRHDDTRFNQWVMANHEGVGFGISTVSGFLAQMAGGAADPTNFIPFVGPAMRVAMQARLGVVGGRAAAGSIDAMLGAAMTQPFVAYSRQRIGDEYTFSDAILDVALAGIVGAAFGTGSGVLARRGEVRHQANVAAARATLTDLRVADEAITKTVIAMDQIASGRAVDVPEVSRASRDAMLQGLSIEERIRFVAAAEDAARPARGQVSALEEMAVRAPTLAQREMARLALDPDTSTPALRIDGQVIRQPEPDTRVSGAARGEATHHDLLARLPEGITEADVDARGEFGVVLDDGQFVSYAGSERPQLTRLERMALSDPSPQVRALAQAEIDRRFAQDWTTAAAPRRRPPSAQPSRPARAAALDPVAARTPSTGDASADVDVKAEIERLRQSYGENGMDEAGDFPELAEFQKMEDLTAAERAEFEAAEAEMAKAAKAQEAYDAAIGCLI